MATYTILTRNGIADPGQEAKLAQLAAELKQPGARLLLHLHGGLVDQAAGEAGATRLSGSGADSWQRDAGWTQVYVVWRTGAFETIRSNWTDLVHDDRIYQAILRKLFGFVARRLGVPVPGGRGTTSLALDEAEIERRLTGKGDKRAPFDDVDAQLASDLPAGARATIGGEQSNGDLAIEFEAELAADSGFQRAAVDLDEAVNVPAGARAPSAGADSAAGARIRARLSADIQAKFVAPATPGTGVRGIVSTSGILLVHAGKVALRCFKRFRAGRDHGLHATIVEEVCREFYGDLVGARIWGMMVRDAGDHFARDGFGSALVAMLNGTTPANIAVTAHSAGSIWASHLLLAMEEAGLTHKVKLYLLAPAVRHDVFADMIGKAGHLIGRCHMFMMSDELERRDAVLGHNKGYIYPSSLLYLVSGMFEEQDAKAYPDVPLLGMRRFAGASWLTPQEAAAATSIGAFFQAADRGIAWSPSAGVTVADSHGAFDDEIVTLASVRALF